MKAAVLLVNLRDGADGLGIESDARAEPARRKRSSALNVFGDVVGRSQRRQSGQLGSFRLYTTPNTTNHRQLLRMR